MLTLRRNGRGGQDFAPSHPVVSANDESLGIEAGPGRRHCKQDEHERGPERDRHPKPPNARDWRPPAPACLHRHAITYFSIASATPSCATSATTASAIARSCGGDDPIAMAKPAASSSGASFQESPMAIVLSMPTPNRAATNLRAVPLSVARIENFHELR